ncbi:hypothetical protein [uncultured Jatrophihabitans sp.]|uniref:hypothetical protein n=1 Tax=uncultured Jatrophihabitans sp. TaxID=1610747 RepID=UPI0035CB1B63
MHSTIHESITLRDHAFNRLTTDFPDIPVRIVLDVFLSFLDRTSSVSAAVDLTRERILDACLAA